MRMRWRLARGLMALAAALISGSARASEPVIGGQIGAAAPISSFRDTAQDGGNVEIFGGYRFDLAERVAVSLLGAPTFSFFGTRDCGARPTECDDSDDVTSLVQLMGGPRLSLMDSDFEIYFDARGGYVAQMTGGLDDDDGPGFVIGGGINYEFLRGTAAGIFFRYNEAFMEGRNRDAGSGSGANLKFISAGIGMQHRFLPPPVVVAEAPPPAPPPPPPPPPKKRIILRGVNFDFDKADIRPDARPVLDEAIRTLQDAGDVRIAVSGHTDSRGTDEYNQGLSVRRAQAVADYLVAGGIDRSRLQVEGFGEAQPIASNETDDGRAQNRRVELNIIGNGN